MFDSIFESIRSVIKSELAGLRSGDEEEYVGEEPELILLYHPECPSCKKWIEAFADLIKEGVVRKVSISSVYGMQIAHKLNDFSVPQLVMKLGQVYHTCDVRLEGDDLVFDCEFEEVKKN